MPSSSTNNGRSVTFLLRQPRQTQGFQEVLAPDGVAAIGRARDQASLALTLLWIPPGRFWKEGPGEQWGRELKLDPSRFLIKDGKGENKVRLLEGESNTDQRPVEQVSWEDAMEFCHRLSLRTGRTYALPSEAQWEYACRAGTTTPFHFGDTISPELANYRGDFAYADGPQGVYRKQTTPVGMFPANAWGLHDMHGNVWEWCLDEWHDSYEGAPTDGRAWLDAAEREKSKESVKTKLLRGGSWNVVPRFCRSAFRYLSLPVNAIDGVGFRVVCLPQGPSLNP